MERPSYLNKFAFDWELFEVVVGGKSALDSHSFLGSIGNDEEIEAFLGNYGFEQSDPVLKAELFGIFQEAIQFVKRYFLIESNPDGLDLKIPNSLYTIVDVKELFTLATGNISEGSFEDCLWAGIILKVMHTILHTDKDLRSNYFGTIQQQIFDRFYKYLQRDKQGQLYLESHSVKIPLVDFETKSKKQRDSVIIKLLHKAENVAEQLFDRIGVRFVTETRIDTLRVIKFLSDNHLVIPHNVKPSRSINTLVDLKSFKSRYKSLIKMCIRNNLSEERFVHALERETIECLPSTDRGGFSNKHTSNEYRSIQFTCRQLIRYTNPFYIGFKDLRKEAKSNVDSPLAEKILKLDTSHIAKDLRFFYPFEIQVVDREAHKMNTIGEASHEEYKKSQLKMAMYRLFKPLLDYRESRPEN